MFKHVFYMQRRCKHGYFHINRNMTRPGPWYGTQVFQRGWPTKFPWFEQGNIIAMLRLTECDCQIVNWPLAIPIKRVISLKSHFVMSVIYSAHWVTIWIGALWLAGYWHASICLQSLWVDEWVSVFCSLNMFLFLFCHFLSFKTFIHHGMASLCQCMLSSAVCKYMSVSYDVFWCLLNCVLHYYSADEKCT